MGFAGNVYYGSFLLNIRHKATGIGALLVAAKGAQFAEMAEVLVS
jgi:hypothetical protein